MQHDNTITEGEPLENHPNGENNAAEKESSAAPKPEKPAKQAKKEKAGKTTPPPTPPAEPKNKRYALTANFTQAEGNHLDAIIKSRIENGLSRDNSHFVKQCIDLAINLNAVNNLSGIKNPAVSFGVPDEVSPRLLKDGYFAKHINTIEVCS